MVTINVYEKNKQMVNIFFWYIYICVRVENFLVTRLKLSNQAVRFWSLLEQVLPSHLLLQEKKKKIEGDAGPQFSLKP